MKKTITHQLLLTVLAGSAFTAPLANAGTASVIEPEMVTIPGGKFTMGGDKQREQPKHPVTIRPFKLAKYEVTVKEFRQFIEATGHKTRNVCWIWQEVTKDHDWGINRLEGNWQTPKYAPSDDHPVMCVTWEDANAYAGWLGKKTGKAYRLPTEAEWEYAARAGSTTTYFFGNDPEQFCEYGNVLDKRGTRALARDYKVYREGVSCDDGAEYTNVVGQYKPNAFGLYDMLGNVDEYVQDCEHLDYTGAPADGSAWSQGCSTDNPMVIERGGSYGSRGTTARSAYRGHAGPDNPSALGEGFRLAESVDANSAAN